jgi:hypothetical protein
MMDGGWMIAIIGPTVALAVASAAGAVIVTRGNSLRIGITEKALETEHNENVAAHAEMKRLIIESENRILQALRNSRTQ